MYCISNPVKKSSLCLLDRILLHNNMVKLLLIILKKTIILSWNILYLMIKQSPGCALPVFCKSGRVGIAHQITLSRCLFFGGRCPPYIVARHALPLQFYTMHSVIRFVHCFSCKKLGTCPIRQGFSKTNHRRLFICKHLVF